MSSFCLEIPLTTPASGESQLSSEDVEAILNTMFFDQEEHQFFSFCPTYAKYRSIVCQWMLDLGDHFNLHETTSHAAIAYLDRLQPNEKFSRNQWQMLGICCIIMAAKYNENEEHVPDLSALQNITQQDIPREELLKYELWALQRMGWILCARTVPAFLSCYNFLGIIFESDINYFLRRSSAHCADENSELNRLEKIVRKQCSALATMTALDPRFKPFPCSLVAAAVLFVSRRSLGVTSHEVWPNELALTTRYRVDDLLDLVHMIDVASEEITRWIHSGKQIGTATEVSAHVNVNATTTAQPIHPSLSAESIKTPIKYDVKPDDTGSGSVKDAAAFIEKLSPVSIIDQVEGDCRLNGKGPQAVAGADRISNQLI